MSKNQNLPLLKYLEEKGIMLNDLINTAIELFVSHLGVKTKDEAVKLLKEELLEALFDVNVSCFIVACFCLKKATQELVPGLSVERFKGRPGLVADELLGMTIADCIAGVKGIFE